MNKNQFKIQLKNVFELLLVMLPLVVFGDISLLSSYTFKNDAAVYIIVVIAMNIFFLLLLLKAVRKIKVCDAKVFLMTYYPVFIIFAIFILLFLTVSDSWMNLDGYIYYKDLRNMKYWNMRDFNHFMLAGHMSQGYTMLVMIGEFLFPDNVIGVRIIHCIMAFITIMCFYNILQNTFKKIGKLDLTLYTSLFTFNPLFLGMISEINTDFPMLCFLVWMICAFINKKILLECMCAIMLCFSKEPGCILYGFFLMGVVIYRLFAYRKISIKEYIKKIFSVDIIIPVIAGVMWIINRITYSGQSWGDSALSNTGKISGYHLNTIAIYPKYIWTKVMQMLFMNFSFVPYFLLLFLIFSLILFGKKIISDKLKLQAECFMGIIISFISFVAYNFIYITFIHYRYLIPFVFFISLATPIALECCIEKAKVRKCFSIIFLILLILSNFYTLDPFSRKIFMTQGTGIDEILIPSTMNSDSDSIVTIADKSRKDLAKMNNSAVYNFQCAHLKSCFDKALKKVKYNERKLIILPRQYRDEFGTKASIFGVNIIGINEIYWSSKDGHVQINCANLVDNYKNDNSYDKLNIRVLKSLSELSESERNKYEEIYYFEMPFDKQFNHSTFLNNNKVISKSSVQCFSWKWNIDRIK